MKILYFTRDFSPHDDRFLKVLAKSGNETFLLRLEGGELSARGIELPQGIQEISWAGGKGPYQLWNTAALRQSLTHVIAELKPDLVHAGPLYQGAFLTALTGFRPLVSMSWGYDLMHDIDVSRFARWQTGYALARSSVLLVDCQASAGKAQKLGFSQKRIVNFPWGVDLKHFSPGDGSELRRKLGWQDKFIILCNRSWEPKYGVDLLIKSFLQGCQKNQNLRLLLAGTGSQADRFDQMIRSAGAEAITHRPGRIGLNDLPAYYRAADLFVSASHVDGSSVSLLEALACGCPAAVSSIPANLEWVEPGLNGWVFADGDACALEEVILGAAANQADLEKMGLEGRETAESRADWEKNSQELFRAYAMALENLL